MCVLTTLWNLTFLNVSNTREKRNCSRFYRIPIDLLHTCQHFWLPTAQWYMVLNKRVQCVFFVNILTKFWQITFILLPLSNKEFRGLMVRRPAFHQNDIRMKENPDFKFYFSYPHVPLCQGCQEEETPLKISKTPIFRGVSWHPWVAQNFLNIFFIW